MHNVISIHIVISIHYRYEYGSLSGYEYGSLSGKEMRIVIWVQNKGLHHLGMK